MDDVHDDVVHLIKSSPAFIFACRFFHYYCVPLNLLPSSHLYSIDITEDAPFIPQVLERLFLQTTYPSIKSEWIAEPFIKLLRALCSWRHINNDNWIDQGLVKEYSKRGLTPPFNTDVVTTTTILDLDMQQRVTVLSDLCEWLLRSSDTLRSLVPDYGTVLRLESVNDMAFDGEIYYVMEDTRLYSCTNDKNDNVWNSNWKLIAANNEQYETFLNNLESKIAESKGKQKKIGQELLKSIQVSYDEWIRETLREQERQTKKITGRRDASPSKSKSSSIYSSYYPEGVTKRSSRLAEKEAKLKSEMEAKLLEERQREAERLTSLREQSRIIPTSSDDTGDLNISDRERRRLLRTEKKVIEEAKEAEIAAIEAKYLKQIEDDNILNDEMVTNYDHIQNKQNYEGSPKIKIILKAKSPERTENVEEQIQIDVVKKVDTAPMHNVIPLQQEFHPTPRPIIPPPIPTTKEEGKSLKPPFNEHVEKISTPQLMGDAKLLAEFAEELQHPETSIDEHTNQLDPFDSVQDKDTRT